MNIADNLERGARLFPEQAALLFEGKRYSYRLLNELGNRMANGLRKLNVARGDRVALFLPNIPEFAIAYFGIQKVGAIAVSLNASLKSEEVRFIADDCGAVALITTETLAPNVPREELEHLRHLLIAEGRAAEGTESLAELLEGSSPTAHCAEMQRDDPAAILYTSGTTGFPKGATLSHGNVISNTYSFVHNCGVKPDDTLLLFLPLFHCFGQNAILNSALCAGATIVMQRKFAPEQAMRAIVDEQITQLYAVPSVFISLYEHASAEEMGSIRYYFSAAAGLPEEVAIQWHEKYGRVIHEGYGLTETSPFASYNHFLKFKSGSIGMPIENVEMRIVNFDDQPVPPGELGEIIIRGPNVMLGYWNRPAETAGVLKEGWFHSGDIGRMDEEGYFYIADRVKDMINVDGMKVYPVEIENILYQHPAVSEAAVYGIPDTLLGEQVKANIVLKREHSATEEEIIAFCRTKIADFKIPTSVTFVDTLPKNPTGKILKRVLREKHQRPSDSPAAAQPAVFSVGEIQEWLIRWLLDNLDVEREEIQLRRSFVEYGLTSILAVKLTDELAGWLGHTLPATTTWSYSSVESLSAYLCGKFAPAPSAEEGKERLKQLSDGELADLLAAEIGGEKTGGGA
ncbi:long-chain-fatty-acid--CoA ligase [Endothiovibrio diazotrophicus]